MSKTNQYDLEERTFVFARNVVFSMKQLPKIISNTEYCKQVIRSSSSIGLNYIEANEALSKKDFLMRIRIARKEAKETVYWPRLLLETNGNQFKDTIHQLIDESIELKKILSATFENSQ